MALLLGLVSTGCRQTVESVAPLPPEPIGAPQVEPQPPLEAAELEPLADPGPIEAVLRHLVRNSEFRTRGGRGRVVPRLTNDSPGFISKPQLRGELSPERFAEIEPLLDGLLKSNCVSKLIQLSEPIAGIFLGTSMLPLIDYHRAELIRPFVEPPPLVDAAWESDMQAASGWVSFWSPSIADDGATALVRFSLGPGVGHGIVGTSLLSWSAANGWQLTWTDVSHFL